MTTEQWKRLWTLMERSRQQDERLARIEQRIRSDA